jgi:HPt (histidine-containing phosphotransfer) domain-containing protein
LNEWIRDKKPPELVEEARRQKESTFIPPVGESTAEDAGFLTLLKKIDGLNVDAALDAMSGLRDVYLDTAKLTIRLLPKRISKMDRFISEDIKAFTVEVHGLKNVLKNIGAAALGNDAAVLERAALENNRPYCDEFYPPFRAALSELADRLSAVFSKNGDELKKPADKSSFLQAVSDAKTAAESFDRDSALEILMPHMGFTYGEQADKILKAVVSALETFDCEAALESMTRLEAEF